MKQSSSSYHRIKNFFIIIHIITSKNITSKYHIKKISHRQNITIIDKAKHYQKKNKLWNRDFFLVGWLVGWLVRKKFFAIGGGVCATCDITKIFDSDNWVNFEGKITKSNFMSPRRNHHVLKDKWTNDNYWQSKDINDKLMWNFDNQDINDKLMTNFDNQDINE